MCHSNDSRPPAPPNGQPIAGAEETHLTSADGTRYMAFRARPANPNGAGVVILPDIRGLHTFYKDLAKRFAETGVESVAIDYFGRTLPDSSRQEGPEVMMPLVAQLTPEQVAADVRAAVDSLLDPDGGGCSSVFVLGFCFGGSHAWNQSAFDERVAGCIGFYGRPDDCRPFIDRMRRPLLILAAGADMLTQPDDNRRFEAELTAAGVEHEYYFYEGAPHSFFDGAGGFDDACADAWQRVLGFIETHAGAGERSHA